MRNGRSEGKRDTHRERERERDRERSRNNNKKMKRERERCWREVKRVQLPQQTLKNDNWKPAYNLSFCQRCITYWLNSEESSYHSNHMMWNLNFTLAKPNSHVNTHTHAPEAITG